MLRTFIRVLFWWLQRQARRKNSSSLAATMTSEQDLGSDLGLNHYFNVLALGW